MSESKTVKAKSNLDEVHGEVLHESKVYVLHRATFFSERRLTNTNKMELPTSRILVRPTVCDQVWIGTVVDPHVPDYSTTVSITWAEPCEVEVRLVAAPMHYRYLLVSTECHSAFILESPFAWR